MDGNDKPKMTAWHYDSDPGNYDPTKPLPVSRPSTDNMANYMVKDATVHNLTKWYLRLGLLVPVAIIIWFVSAALGLAIIAFTCFSLAAVIARGNKSPSQTIGVVICSSIGIIAVALILTTLL